jgi:dUTP pyrophosphatase
MTRSNPRKGSGKFLPCHTCYKVFYVTPSRLRKNKYHNCSTKCLGRMNSLIYSTKIKTNCVTCDKEISYKQSHFKKIRAHTCSIECSAKERSIRIKGAGNSRYLGLSSKEKIFWERVKSCKLRSDTKKIDLDIDYKFLMNVFEKQNGLCYYTGIPMLLGQSDREFGFSVDRIDSEKGYTKDNIVLCINAINRAKGSLEMNVFRNILREIKNKYQQKRVVQCKRLTPTAKLPTVATEGSAGYDLYVDRIEDHGEYIKIYTGIAVCPDENTYFLLTSRSSAYKVGLSFYTGIGVIDNDYRGEIIAIFEKTKDYKTLPNIGDRLIQLIPQDFIRLNIESVDELSITQRSIGGFGSSGT